jgi:norsolorinic acid ketoreductase
MSKVYLVTGASRGIGLGLTTALLQRPNTTVIAAVRDPSKATALQNLHCGNGSKIIIIKIDSGNRNDPATAILELQTQHGINVIDVVICNAGISDYYGPVSSTPLIEFQRHLEINTIAPIGLFQAVVPLLKKSAKPKFVGMSTRVASMADMGGMPLPAAAYGASKAALNYWIRKAHFENPWLIAFSLSPGYVPTFSISNISFFFFFFFLLLLLLF